jgi:AcrR family transcriptional regulator
MDKTRADWTREMILRTATTVFFQRGYENTRTKEIADQADVSEALLFKYFPTKEALYIAVFNYTISERRGVLVQYFEAHDPLAWLYRFAKDIIFPDKDTPDFMLFFSDCLKLQNAHFSKAAVTVGGGDLERDFLVPIMQKGQQTGQIIDRIDATLLVSVYWRFILGCVCGDLHFPGSNSPGSLDAMMEMISADITENCCS